MAKYSSRDVEYLKNAILVFHIDLLVDSKLPSQAHHRYSPTIAKCLQEDIEYTITVSDFTKSEAIIPALNKQPNVDKMKYLLLPSFRRYQHLNDRAFIKKSLQTLLKQAKASDDTQTELDCITKLSMQDYTVNDTLQDYFASQMKYYRSSFATTPVGITTRRQYLQMYRLLHHQHL